MSWVVFPTIADIEAELLPLEDELTVCGSFQAASEGLLDRIVKLYNERDYLRARKIEEGFWEK